MKISKLALVIINSSDWQVVTSARLGISWLTFSSDLAVHRELCDRYAMQSDAFYCGQINGLFRNLTGTCGACFPSTGMPEQEELTPQAREMRVPPGRS